MRDVINCSCPWNKLNGEGVVEAVLIRTVEERNKILRAFVVIIVRRVIGDRRRDWRLDEMLVSDFLRLSNHNPRHSRK